MRGIKEYLANNAQPSAYQFYIDALKASDNTAPADAKPYAVQARGSKLAAGTAIQAKHAARSAWAMRALASKPSKD